MIKTKAVGIRNDFHSTAVVAYAKIVGQDLHLSASQVRDIKRRLCGVTDCVCGGHLGERGPQSWRYEIDPLIGGGVDLYPA